MQTDIINVGAVIEYIENNSESKLNLDIIANAVNYSKYHLHRVFTSTVGLTIHDYVLRRKLTQAAKLLVFSHKPIIEIALTAGYESQQAFSAAFKSMYKKSPHKFAEEAIYYPLQLPYVLNSKPTKMEIYQKKDIEYAKESDIFSWMNFVYLVIDGFPYLNEAKYLAQLKACIQKKQAMLIKDKEIIIGAMAFNRETKSIDFLGIHPQYKKSNIAEAFLHKILNEVSQYTHISVTTFREGDKADTGYRDMYKKLGFAQDRLLTEFGYPTQRFIFPREAQHE